MSNLSDLLPAGAGGKQVSFVASGTLTAGQAVALQSDGAVTAISASNYTDFIGVTDAVISDTIKTVFFAFGIIYLFWPSDDAYFLLHQSKRYSILFLLRT